jgi:hypothetical protein
LHELLKQFLREFFTLVYAAWTAPPDQAAELIGALAAQIVYLLLVFLVVRWLWRKMLK